MDLNKGALKHLKELHDAKKVWAVADPKIAEQFTYRYNLLKYFCLDYGLCDVGIFREIEK